MDVNIYLNVWAQCVSLVLVEVKEVFGSPKLESQWLWVNMCVLVTEHKLSAGAPMLLAPGAISAALVPKFSFASKESFKQETLESHLNHNLLYICQAKNSHEVIWWL